MLIAGILLARHQHLSADDVLMRVKEQEVSVSKATVYNTLSLFTERGLVRAISIDGSRTFYDSNTTDHNHLYNLDSGELTDIASEKISAIDIPDLPDGVELQSADLIVKIRKRPQTET